ncbi:MAG: DUF4398 domain-containing protein [Deltaproteobacteria bacterium]|nr:DUF4398 domain-containing protein [Deltaproteobacteria bacterium]
MPTVVLLLVLVGCTAGRSVFHVWSAERSLDDAIAAGADTRALYEFTLAREYLEKAKEESGYSDYKDAEQLARKAEKWAVQALEVSTHGSSERERLLQEVEEVVPEEITQPTYNPMVPLEPEDD